MIHLNVFDLSRQVNYLVKRGKSSSEALQQVENTATAKSKNDMASVRMLFNNEDANQVSSVHFRFRKNLKMLMDMADKHNGDRAKLFTGFYRNFIKNESDFDMSIFDVSGLLLYLVAVVVVAVICVAIYSIFVLPEFETLFSDFGQELPQLTSLVLTITGEYTSIVIALVSLSIIGIFLLMMHVKNTLKRLGYFRPLMVRLPVIGTIVKKYNQYLQLSFINLMIGAGVDTKTAIEEISMVFGDDLGLLNDSSTMSNQVLQMALELGTFEEETEFQLAQLKLKGINDFTQIKSTILIVSIVIVATVVGSVVIAMYLPIFQMGKLLG